MIDDFDVAATELYRERFIKAFAHDLQVSLLILDSSVLAPYDEASNEEEWTSSGESKSNDKDVEALAAVAIRKSGLAVAIYSRFIFYCCF
ncbi:hypothetical protein L1987_69489 [Smallanthus sonchifolius]|uniref:Uncharacterized protein n=1 Tax=Smallanthus sonchifolius TaxID=185202 RepID=A0ACB9B660_9ASTR|nr:hypothetical protein L1987_69489 [Smallanthus sonchifolius]